MISHRWCGRLLVAGAAIIMSFAFTFPVSAEPVARESAFSATSPYLLGDWGGARTDLAKKGVFLFFDYDGQAVHNIAGGRRSITRLANQWIFGASLNLDTFLNWHGGAFDIMVVNRSGRDLSQDASLGANFGVVNNFGIAETWYLTKFAFDQQWLSGKLDWRIGKTPVTTDFNNSTAGCDFMNLVFCAGPITNVTTYSTFFPMGRWGTRLKYTTDSKAYFELGAYQVSPEYYNASWEVHHGLTLDIPKTTGWLFPVQYGWKTSFGGMDGDYDIGMWYSTAPVSDLFFNVMHTPITTLDDVPLTRHSGYGLYVNLVQRVTDDGSGRGVSVFFNAIQSNPKTEPVDQEFNIGFKYDEPFGRANDYAAVGLGTYRNNFRAYETYIRLHGSPYNPDTGTYVGSGLEYNLEAFYSWSVIKAIQLIPSVQYIVHPSGSSLNKDIVVVGLTTKVSL